MSEAPRKQWIHNNFWESSDASYWARDEKESEEYTQYIRADLVDDIAELLRLLYKRGTPLTVTVREGIVAALKQLEESNGRE